MELKSNFVFLAIIVFLVLFISNLKYYNILPRKREVCDCEKIEDCFFDNIISMDKSTTPKIFIHIDDPNNILGLYQLCIESCMKYCSSTYDIILYTNQDISKMIDEEDDILCNIKNVNLLSGQDLKQWEEYCKFKILYKYGGVVMKPYFLFSSHPDCLDFLPDNLKICRVNNEGISVSNKLIIPTSCYMVAAPKKDPTTKIYLDYLSKKCQNDYTSDTKYFNKTFEQLSHIDYIPEESIGVVDTNHELVHLDDILDGKPIKLNSCNYCLFINMSLLNKQRHRGWILNMSKEQILETSSVLSNYAKM